MSNSFFMSFGSFTKYICYLIIFVLLICIFFIPIINLESLASSENGYSFIISSNEYIWPIPGYTTVTSYFGKRISPTSGASSYHKGIDIAAPEGTKLYAVTSGEITFTGFLGGGGYTITLTSDSMKFTYCHVSPTYIVSEGDSVEKGQLIRIRWS